MLLVVSTTREPLLANTQISSSIRTCSHYERVFGHVSTMISNSVHWFCFRPQDMYFKYIWNNFLHIQVEICTALILALPPSQTGSLSNTEEEYGRESLLISHVRPELQCKQLSKCFLLSSWYDIQSRSPHSQKSVITSPLPCQQLFKKCQFIQRIVDAWSSNEKEQ